MLLPFKQENTDRYPDASGPDKKYADVAQLAECISDTDAVGGSIPSISTAVAESPGGLRGLISLVTRFVPIVIGTGLRYLFA